ncbi:hypothetical protein TWF718_005933 [Orbilia javanica]|uniref:Uncharacterized protein n=1 Tax=Orbilia javanica TaxID=47235 RepID=A0AAN8N4B4_9PEZI
MTFKIINRELEDAPVQQSQVASNIFEPPNVSDPIPVPERQNPAPTVPKNQLKDSVSTQFDFASPAAMTTKSTSSTDNIDRKDNTTAESSSSAADYPRRYAEYAEDFILRNLKKFGDLGDL